MPNISSRLLICRLTAPCVTDNSSAAAVILERRTVASSARSAFRDGRFAPKAASLASVVSFFHSFFSYSLQRCRGPEPRGRIPLREYDRLPMLGVRTCVQPGRGG